MRGLMTVVAVVLVGAGAVTLAVGLVFPPSVSFGWFSSAPLPDGLVVINPALVVGAVVFGIGLLIAAFRVGMTYAGRGRVPAGSTSGS
jgi:hypothetical protein